VELTKTYTTITGTYSFLFNFPDTYNIYTGFDIVSMGEQTFGYEDQDELSIFPGTLKFTLTDFEWKNFIWFKKSLDEEGLKNTTSTDVQYYFPISVKVTSETENLGTFFITDAEQNLEDYTLDILVTNGYDRLNRISVNNPYILMKMENLGYLKSERLRNITYGGGWRSGAVPESLFGNPDISVTVVGSHLAKAFGEISPFGYINDSSSHSLATRQRYGFTMRQVPFYANSPKSKMINATLLDPLSVPQENIGNKEVDFGINKKVPYDAIDPMVGKLKIKDFILACLKIINPNVTLEINNNLKFGNQDTPTEVGIQDLFINRPYRLIFGRSVILQRTFYETNCSAWGEINCFASDLTLNPGGDGEPGSAGASKMSTTPVLIHKDDYWIAWDVSGAEVEGAQDKSVSATLKDFCKSFFSGLDYKSYEKVVFYKRGFQVPGIPNPFGDGDGFGESNLISLRKRYVKNIKKFVKVSWLNHRQSASIGNVTQNEEEVLSYDVKYSAQKGIVYTIHLQGIGYSGGVPIISPDGSITPSGNIGMFGAGLATIKSLTQGNVYFKTGSVNILYYVTVVKDSVINYSGTLLDYICKVEYETRKNNRPNYDIEAWGLDYKMDTIYQINPNSSNNFDEIKKVRPTEIVLNREKNTTKITAIEVL